MKNRAIFPFVMLLLAVMPLAAAKVKDMATVVGVRDNQIIGYGLVVGLNGTGDGTTSVFTTQSLSNLLANVNVKIDPAAIKSKNIAAVIVTAKLPPFSRQGDKIDVSVSSIGDAKSIEGGTLLLTPLKAVDGKIYALAQGPVAIGGVNAGGGGGNRTQKNQTTGATIFSGGIVERDVVYDLASMDNATLSLKQSNFQNALNLQQAINASFGTPIATAIDPATVRIVRPKTLSMVEFLAKVESIPVTMDQASPKIVIDERTGTIVAGADIPLSPVVITHGDITIKVRPQNAADKTAAGDIAIGDAVTVGTQSNIVTENGGLTISAIARALQKLGSKPKDIISIVEALKKAGACTADLEII